MSLRIPLSLPDITEAEIEAVTAVLVTTTPIVQRIERAPRPF